MKTSFASLSFCLTVVVILGGVWALPAEAEIYGGCKADCDLGKCETSNRYGLCGCCPDGQPYCDSPARCNIPGSCSDFTITGTLGPVTSADIAFTGVLTKIARSFGPAGEAVAVAAEQVLDAATLGDTDAYVDAVMDFDAGVEALEPKAALVIKSYVAAEGETQFD